MTEHRIFYYPYASFTNTDLPLLKAAALYFDKLYILDPVGASWGPIGADLPTREAVKLLSAKGILETITPSKVLESYEEPLVKAIRSDLQDRDFLNYWSSHGAGEWWTLALAKVPTELQQDRTMQRLLGEDARQIVREVGDFPGPEHTAEFAYKPYDIREGYEGLVEYRFIDVGSYPLAVGEAIMLNHALFAGLVDKAATPITDLRVHQETLSLKLRRAVQDPVVRQVLEDRARERQIKADLLTTAALTDRQLNLPVLNPKMPLEEVLQYRDKHEAALQEARDKLGWMARRIEAEPWDDAFIDELERETIPDIADKLKEVRKARDSWLRSQGGHLALQAAGVTIGTAEVLLTVFAAPLTPVALAIAGLSLATSTAIPGVQWLLDWRDGKQTVQENGLHYLLTH